MHPSSFCSSTKYWVGHKVVKVNDPFSLPLHRAFSIFLFSPSNGYKLLLQQRAMCKVTFPGIWSNTCCSHPLVTDDDIHYAMNRKLHDELGIRLDAIRREEFIPLGRMRYAALSKDNPNWGEHECKSIFFLLT
jgi:isopentenyl-diphosphate delta-isomerase